MFLLLTVSVIIIGSCTTTKLPLRKSLYWALRRGAMIRKLVSLDLLQLNSVFDPQCVLHTFGVVSPVSYAY